MGKKRTFSSVIDRVESTGGKRGVRPYNREQIYQWLYDHSDSRGIIIYQQKEVAQKIDINYQAVCQIYKDFCDIGYLKKYGKFFEVVHHPDELDWSAELEEELSRVRKQHQKYYDHKQGE